MVYRYESVTITELSTNNITNECSNTTAYNSRQVCAMNKHQVQFRHACSARRSEAGVRLLSPGPPPKTVVCAIVTQAGSILLGWMTNRYKYV